MATVSEDYSDEVRVWGSSIGSDAGDNGFTPKREGGGIEV